MHLAAPAACDARAERNKSDTRRASPSIAESIFRASSMSTSARAWEGASASAESTVMEASLFIVPPCFPMRRACEAFIA
jgi:hypothetical protein